MKIIRIILNLLLNFFVIITFLTTFTMDGLAQEQVEKRLKILKENSYFEAGVIIGSPSFLNGSIGYWFGPVGLRVSGMYSDKSINGIQFNLGYKLKNKAGTFRSLGIAIGRAQDLGCDYSYLGPVYDWNYKRVFLEIGVGKIFNVKRGDFSSLPYWAIFQIGYMFHFI